MESAAVARRTMLTSMVEPYCVPLTRVTDRTLVSGFRRVFTLIPQAPVSSLRKAVSEGGPPSPASKPGIGLPRSYIFASGETQEASIQPRSPEIHGEGVPRIVLVIKLVPHDAAGIAASYENGPPFKRTNLCPSSAQGASFWALSSHSSLSMAARETT